MIPLINSFSYQILPLYIYIANITVLLMDKTSVPRPMLPIITVYKGQIIPAHHNHISPPYGDHTVTK